AVRYVTVAGTECPCGGTHVKSSAEIGGVEAYSVKTKKGMTKVYYKMS
ncbi:hypothetical protein SARC_15895, partial [Sphaeroforma arctica JP610]